MDGWREVERTLKVSSRHDQGTGGELECAGSSPHAPALGEPALLRSLQPHPQRGCGPTSSVCASFSQSSLRLTSEPGCVDEGMNK